MQISKWVIVGFQLNSACKKKAAKTVKTSLAWVLLMTANQSYIKRVFSRIKFDKSDWLIKAAADQGKYCHHVASR